MMSFSLPLKSRIDPLPSLYKFHTTADVLRLDLVHPVISGNKWFKLKYYLEEAKHKEKKLVVTYGGAFSNHIVATAAAAKQEGLKSIGIIRGEKFTSLSPTLTEALSFGMNLEFIGKEAYKKAILPASVLENYKEEEIYLIPAGGYGKNGMLGAKEILKTAATEGYTHIIAAAGTGTMVAGLVESAEKHQKIIGISVLKNNFSVQQGIQELLNEENYSSFGINYDYHFGGYAKYNAGLLDFMNTWYHDNKVPSDFVYTAKLFFAVNDLAQKNFFQQGSKILVIHSGGLQGNRSLPEGRLIF